MELLLRLKAPQRSHHLSAFVLYTMIATKLRSYHWQNNCFLFVGMFHVAFLFLPLVSTIWKLSFTATQKHRREAQR